MPLFAFQFAPYAQFVKNILAQAHIALGHVHTITLMMNMMTAAVHRVATPVVAAAEGEVRQPHHCHHALERLFIGLLRQVKVVWEE